MYDPDTISASRVARNTGKWNNVSITYTSLPSRDSRQLMSREQLLVASQSPKDFDPDTQCYQPTVRDELLVTSIFLVVWFVLFGLVFLLFCFVRRSLRVMHRLAVTRLETPYDLLCAHTRRHRKRVTYDEVRVVDGNPHCGRKSAQAFFKRNKEGRLMMHGFTAVGEVRIPFPMPCDPKTVLRFVEQLEKLPPRHKRSLVLEGWITEEVLELLKPCFASYLTCSIDPSAVDYVSIVLSSYFGGPIWFVLLWPLAVLCDVFGPASPIYVVFEEVLNWYCGVVPIIIVETITRLHKRDPLVLIVPALLHICWSCLPLPFAIIAHLVYNHFTVYYASSYFSCSVEDFSAGSIDFAREHRETIAEISFWIDVARKIYAKDIPGLVLSVGMRAESASIMNIFGFDSIISFVKELVAASDDEILDSVVALAEGEEEDRHKMRDLLLGWLPVSVRKSPTFSKVAALLAMMMFSKWFTNLSGLRTIGEYMTDKDFVCTTEVASVAISAVTGVFSGLKRIALKGDLRAFFDEPRDVAFLTEAYEVVKRTNTKMTLAELIADMHRIEGLIEGRKYCQNTPTIERAISDLKKILVQREDFRRTWVTRKQPMAVWINGPPGSGKTTVVETVCDVITKCDKVERWPGDTVPVILKDKFPISVAAHPLAYFFFFNDVANDHSQASKEGLMPLDLAMQISLDTCVCSFPQAAVEDKGTVFNEIKADIFSSNHREFVMSQDTEKLIRRLESGVLVDMYYVLQGTNKQAKYSQIKDYPDGIRNDCMRFRVLTAKNDDKHLVFCNTEVVMNLPQFLEYTARRYEEHSAAAERSHSKFSMSAKRCACGIVEAYHITSRVNGIKHQFNDIPWCHVEGTYLCLNKECVVPKDYGTFIPFFDKKKTASIDTAVSVLAAIYYAMMIAGLICLYGLYQNRHFVWQQAFESAQVVTDEAIFKVLNRSPATKRFFLMYAGGWRAYLWYEYAVARQKLRQLRVFLKKHAPILVAGSMGAVVLYSYFRSQSDAESKEPQQLAKPIYAEQVRPDTINFGPTTRERSFPVASVRSWGRGDIFHREALAQTRGVDEDQLIPKVQDAIHKVEFRFPNNPGFVRTVTVLQIAPEYLMFNKHYIMSGGLFLDEEFSITIQDVVKTVHIEDLRGDSTNEFFLIRHVLPMKANSLLKFLANVPVYQHAEILHVSKSGTFRAQARPIKAIMQGATYCSLSWPESPVEGTCSEPVLANLGGGTWALIGAVGYGKEDITGATLISREWFDRMVASDPPIVEQVITEIPDTVKLLALKPQAEIRNVDSAYVVAVGSTNAVGRTFKTSFKPTVVSSEFQAKLSEPVLPPLKLNDVVDGEYVSALLHTVKNVNVPCNISQSEIDECVKSMMPKFAKLVKAHGIKLSPINLTQAFFGCEELGITRIDFNSSMGVFMRELGIRDKFDCFSEEEDGTYSLKPEFLAAVEKYHEAFSKGQVVVPFSEMVPKDELRAASKIRKCKIRLFSVMCGAFNIYARMYLMPLLMLLLKFPEVSECYGGMNAGSSQWNELAQKIKKLMRFFFDMDFSTFDWSHGAEVFQAAALFFYLLALLVGYTEEEASIVRNIFACFQWQLSTYKGDAFHKFKGMPSGVIFTLALNSFVNSFLLRVAWKRLIGDLSEFEEKVDTANVGDDNISSADESVKEKFNMVTISQVYQQLGYVATPANKNAEICTDIPFEDLSFLKRKFLMNEELGEYVAPIEKDSIYKAFCYEKVDAAVTPIERLQDVAGGAQREAFLHGRGFFHEFQDFVVDTFESKGFTTDKLNYESLMNEYKSNAFRTFMLAAPLEACVDA